jgi:RimJ/RimL family protein N-acetyltransferase
VPDPLVQAFPPFGLRVVTPRLELRLPRDEELPRLVALARRGIHPPETMPFGNEWTDRLRDGASDAEVLRFHWSQRAALAPEAWTLVLMVVVDGEPVGGQDLTASRFAQSRSVSSGSWLGQEHQGRGIGTEMRAAILELAFRGLGAEEAHSSAWEDNAASLAVSRKLGYEPNGESLLPSRGHHRRHLNLRLSRERWLARRRDDVELHGVDACLPLLVG